MSESRVNKSSTSNSKQRAGRPMLTGILIGLLLGVGLCSSIAIWIARSPSPFTNRALQTIGVMKGNGTPSVSNDSALGDSPNSPNCSSSAAPDPSSHEKAGATAGNSPLQGSPAAPNNSASSSPDAAPSGSVSEPPKSSSPGNLFIQVGAFSSQDEATKQVELIAQLTGQKARIWASSMNDASKPLYRVRLGSFSQVTETVELTQILKSNGIGFVLVRPATGESPL